MVRLPACAGLNNDHPRYQWGTGHAMELALRPADAGSAGLSRQMIRYWGAFVTTGRPEVPGQPSLPGTARAADVPAAR
jgi:hypothetical protein